MAVDTLGMRGLALGLPEQVAAARQRLAEPIPGLPAPGTVRSVLVLGMGGSGIAGDVARAVAGPVSPVPILTSKHYELPGFVDASTLVVAVSCSGNTEETLEAASAAVEAGAPLVAVSQGGELARLAAAAGAPWVPVPADIVMPRAAIGALTVPVLAVLEQVGLFPGALAAVDEAVGQLRRRRDHASPQSEELAAVLAGTIPVVYGGGPLGAVAAARWKAQLNENAKVAAWANEVPELCHNEAAGWEQRAALTRHGITVVQLRHDFEHPQIERRFVLVDQLLVGKVARVVEVRAQGDGALAQLFDLILQGDLVTLALAALEGVDPGPIDALDHIKRGLSR